MVRLRLQTPVGADDGKMLGRALGAKLGTTLGLELGLELGNEVGNELLTGCVGDLRCLQRQAIHTRDSRSQVERKDHF